MTSEHNGAHQAELSLTEHLAELRTRLIRSAAAVAVGFCICYAFIKPIFAFLSLPLKEVLPPGTTLIFTSYPEAFFTYLKLALTAGLFLASPFILHEIWAFISPGLYPHERKWALPFIFFSSLFFIGGAIFGYFAVFPAAFSFLASYAGADLKLLPSISEYFSLTIKLLLGFGAAFELPIFMVFMALVGIVDARMLRKNRKYALLIIFIIAAVLTPTPDVVNQCLLAGPLLVLYEISIMLVAIIGKTKAPRQ
jgi:sec-independent protein translocase protein TatC